MKKKKEKKPDYTTAFPRTIIIEPKLPSGKGGFKMVFNDSKYFLKQSIAKGHKTTIEALKKKIEASDEFGKSFFAV